MDSFIKEECKRGKWFSWSISCKSGPLLNAFLVLTYLAIHRGLIVEKTQGQSKEEMWGQKGPTSPKIPRIGGRLWPDRCFSQVTHRHPSVSVHKNPFAQKRPSYESVERRRCWQHQEWTEQEMKVTEIPDMRPRVPGSTMIRRTREWLMKKHFSLLSTTSLTLQFICLSANLWWRWWVWIHSSENYHSLKITLVTF